MRGPVTGDERLPIGVALGTVGADAGWWLRSAERLDDAGYGSLWAWDHFVGKGDPTVPVLEQWTILAGAAARTRGIGLGTFIANVMNRHPAVVARMAATLQDASAGRFTLGLGIGGHAREHAMYGIDFPGPPVRVRHLREAIAVIRLLWTGGPVSFEGDHYRLRDAYACPRLDPAPPILVAGQTPGGVRLAAELGDGWAAERPSFEQLAGRYEEALAARGIERATRRVVLGFSGGRSGVSTLPGSPWVEAPRETFDTWRARGVDAVAVTARTDADVDALVDAARHW